ncbi:MAG: hypothetical protein ACREIS_05060 [Nitrospiraceae bacterium]
MSRRTADELADTPLSLVYIAGNLIDAEAAERWLTEAGIEYTLSVEPFTTRSFLGGEHMGLFVYVPTAQHRRCRDLLGSHGLSDTVDLDSSESLERPHGP